MRKKIKKQKQGWKCWLFRENQRLKDSKVFLSKSVKDRRRYMVYEETNCWNCLSNKHIVKKCKSKFSCFKDSCKKRHHTLIHVEIDNQEEESISNNTSSVRNHRKRRHYYRSFQCLLVTEKLLYKLQLY